MILRKIIIGDQDDLTEWKFNNQEKSEQVWGQFCLQNHVWSIGWLQTQTCMKIFWHTQLVLENEEWVYAHILIWDSTWKYPSIII